MTEVEFRESCLAPGYRVSRDGQVQGRRGTPVRVQAPGGKSNRARPWVFLNAGRRQRVIVAHLVCDAWHGPTCRCSHVPPRRAEWEPRRAPWTADNLRALHQRIQQRTRRAPAWTDR